MIVRNKLRAAAVSEFEAVELIGTTTRRIFFRIELKNLLQLLFYIQKDTDVVIELKFVVAEKGALRVQIGTDVWGLGISLGWRVGGCH